MNNPADTIELRVPGMTCGHCESAIKTEVGAVPGVVDVDVDLDTKIVTVTGSGFSMDDLTAAVDEAGFDIE